MTYRPTDLGENRRKDLNCLPWHQQFSCTEEGDGSGGDW